MQTNNAMWLMGFCNAFIEDDVSRKLREFSALGTGWHYGEGVEIAQTALDVARRLNLEGGQLSLVERDAFPGLDGGVTVKFYEGSRVLELTVHPDGTIDYIDEIDRGPELGSDANVSIEEVIEKLQAFAAMTGELIRGAARVWTLSDSSTSDTTTTDGSGVLRAMLSKIPQEEESQSSTWIVLDGTIEPSVNM